MRRTTILLAAIATLAVVVGPVSAAPSAAGNVVAGSGWRLAEDGTPLVEFKVGAQVAPSGKAIGLYRYANIFGLAFGGSITCGNIDSGVAVVGGRVTASSDEALLGEGFFLFLANHGAPVFGSVGPDEVSTTPVTLDGAFVTPDDRLPGSDFPEDFPATCPQARGDTYDNLFEDPSDWRVVLGNVAMN